MEGQPIFADKFFTNTPIGILYRVLKNVEPLVEQPNIKGIVFSFLKAAQKHAEYLAIEKPHDSDLDDVLFVSRILKPVRILFEDKKNASAISFPEFVRFIHQCIDQPQEALNLKVDFFHARNVKYKIKQTA